MNSASDKGKAESGNKRLEQNGYGGKRAYVSSGSVLEHKKALIARLKLMNDAVCTVRNRKDKRRSRKR